MAVKEIFMNAEKPTIELGWPQLARVIFASEGITSGLWRLGVKIRFAGMTMQFQEPNAPETPMMAMPVAASGIEAIALFPAKELGLMVFDAAEMLSPKAPVVKPVPAKTAKARSSPKKKAAS
jgi:hypothetical protein